MDWKTRWITLADFLGQALGADYEVAVHDFTGTRPRLLSLVNPQVSGRAQGAPLSNLALEFLEQRVFDHADYRTGYRGLSSDGQPLRCSTFFIKGDRQELLGMLCINFASGKYDAFARSVTAFLEDTSRLSPTDADMPVEQFSIPLEQAFGSAVLRLFGDHGLPSKPTQAEKLALVRQLELDGVFQLKGSAAKVAQLMGASPASVYRYLSEIRQRG